ncbi:HAD-IA family hydrolase [Mycolicibacterium setense]|uniref:HAD-IA family hydrolase n=1 Tax=Mycolicibacterium setense TaxID=431269 RepID=UPI000575A2AF|nr:HAD-IA family hydrolase [Mycolicibacterium setense]KHO22094.1 haloacid dehalogenase [Mycolicibacterium setense]MCV7113666.1 HAD-IA family hydrolase [Mycolicibacterium setense]
MICAAVFDLDGVIRHFGVDDVVDIERRHHLDEGALQEVAFSQPLLSKVTTGQMTRDEWVHQIGEQIGNATAAAEWSRLTPSIDTDILRLVDELRSIGLITAILTNGTNTIAAELADSGIDAHFDEVFNSADIGHAKPDSRVFRHVLDALGREPTEVFFTDDAASKLEGAQSVGLVTHLFSGVAELRSALTEAGVKLQAR